MRFHDPQRSRAPNGTPCWLDSTLPLPSLQLTPHLYDAGLVMVAVFDEGKVEWPERFYPIDLIPGLIICWNENPEGTFETLFGHPPATRKLWEIREATIDRRVPRHAGCIPQVDSEDLF